MGVVSPWPPDGGSREAEAREFVRAEARLQPEPANTAALTAEAEAELIAEAEAELIKHIDHLGMVSAALVERYAPEAPDDIRDHACIRLIRYLDNVAIGVRSMSTGLGGEVTVTKSFAPGGALRASGAESLLARWRRHQLLVCE